MLICCSKSIIPWRVPPVFVVVFDLIRSSGSKSLCVVSPIVENLEFYVLAEVVVCNLGLLINICEVGS